jgi:hypothetical protein
MDKTLNIFSIALILTIFASCQKEPNIELAKPTISLKTGSYTSNNQEVALGGKLIFGIIANSQASAITNLRIQRKANGQIITELDKGLFHTGGLFEFEYNAVKSEAEVETWIFFIMDSNRDSATISMEVHKAEGTQWGEILHFPAIKLGLQSNQTVPQYLDLQNGVLYSKTSVTGNTAAIDLVAFVYTTGGVLSPTLCCPAYTGSSSVTGYYPEIATWENRNSTLYDYYSSDNNLVDPQQFERAVNDSLLIKSFQPGKVSGLCKYCFKGRIIPFRTNNGKFGLIRILHADLEANGYMEMEVKIQK